MSSPGATSSKRVALVAPGRNFSLSDSVHCQKAFLNEFKNVKFSGYGSMVQNGGKGKNSFTVDFSEN